MIRLLGDRVLVALPPKEEYHTRDSGLVLVTDPELRTHTRGIVVQLGEKRGTVDLDDVRAEVNELFIYFHQWTQADPPLREIFDDIDRALMKMGPAPFEVAVGDLVLWPFDAACEEVTVDGRDCVILHESQLLGIVEPKEQKVA